MAQTAASLPRATSPALRQGDLAFLLQVSRPGLWSTTALFYLMPLGHSIIFTSVRFWVGLGYVLFPLGFLLYGVNDIADAEADQLNPRKGTYLFGSLGRKEQLEKLRWQIAAVQIPFVVLFLMWIGPRVLLWFGVLLFAVALYNAPRIGCKARPPFDVLIQASYLLVFVLSTWTNGARQPPWQTFVFGALFAMHSHLFGEVMDIGPDRASGRMTTAVRIGAVPTKLGAGRCVFPRSTDFRIFALRCSVVRGGCSLDLGKPSLSSKAHEGVYAGLECGRAVGHCLGLQPRHVHARRSLVERPAMEHFVGKLLAVEPGRIRVRE